MRRETVILVWIGGAALAGLLYAVGPDALGPVVGRGMQGLGAAFDALALALTLPSFDAIRAAAIALLAVFVVLAAAAARRGIRARRALLVVTCLFIALVGAGPAGSAPRWLAALGLAGLGAGAMTIRLLRREPEIPDDAGRRFGFALRMDRR